MARPASVDLGSLTPRRTARFATVSGVSIAQTALVFAGIPILVVAVFALLIFGPGEMRQPNRYRPGKPWTYPPVWYIPRPGSESSPSGHRAVAGPARPAIESGTSAPTPNAVGGASGEW